MNQKINKGKRWKISCSLKQFSVRLKLRESANLKLTTVTNTIVAKWIFFIFVHIAMKGNKRNSITIVKKAC